MKNTENYGFNLPEKGEFFDLEHFNENFEGIDEKLKELEAGGGEADTFGGETAEEWQGKIDGKLDKSGGTITGNLSLGDSTENVKRVMGFYNSSRDISEILGTDGTFYAYDHTNNKTIYGSTKDGANTFYGKASECLPLDGGGTIKKDSTVPVTLESTTGTACYQEFRGTSGRNGYFGFEGPDVPAIIGANGNSTTLILHTGNKPKGTYTGNGSATERTIKIGSLSQAIMVRRAGSYNFVIVSPSGYFGVLNGSFVYGNSTVAKESYGDLAIATTSESFNASGATYEYQSL